MPNDEKGKEDENKDLVDFHDQYTPPPLPHIHTHFFLIFSPSPLLPTLGHCTSPPSHPFSPYYEPVFLPSFIHFSRLAVNLTLAGILYTCPPPRLHSYPIRILSSPAPYLIIHPTARIRGNVLASSSVSQGFCSPVLYTGPPPFLPKKSSTLPPSIPLPDLLAAFSPSRLSLILRTFDLQPPQPYCISGFFYPPNPLHLCSAVSILACVWCRHVRLV
jgi:hypothetical protein